jgi:hypothetical protein
MKMGLLKSTDPTTGIDYLDYRDISYWNKYRYRARITFEGIRAIPWSRDITAWVARIKGDNTYRLKGLTADQKKDILDQQVIAEKLLFLNKNKLKDKNYNIRVESNVASIFSNDLDFLKEIRNWHPKIDVSISEAISSQYSGVKYFSRQPKHKYRVYLKSAIVGLNVTQELYDLFQRQPQLTPSKSLMRWIHPETNRPWSRKYCSSVYSIDYDDESTLSYLALMHGEILGKKYELMKRE